MKYKVVLIMFLGLFLAVVGCSKQTEKKVEETPFEIGMEKDGINESLELLNKMGVPTYFPKDPDWINIALESNTDGYKQVNITYQKELDSDDPMSVIDHYWIDFSGSENEYENIEKEDVPLFNFNGISYYEGTFPSDEKAIVWDKDGLFYYMKNPYVPEIEQGLIDIVKSITYEEKPEITFDLSYVKYPTYMPIKDPFVIRDAFINFDKGMTAHQFFAQYSDDEKVINLNIDNEVSSDIEGNLSETFELSSGDVIKYSMDNKNNGLINAVWYDKNTGLYYSVIFSGYKDFDEKMVNDFFVGLKE